MFCFQRNLSSPPSIFLRVKLLYEPVCPSLMDVTRGFRLKNTTFQPKIISNKKSHILLLPDLHFVYFTVCLLICQLLCSYWQHFFVKNLKTRIRIQIDNEEPGSGSSALSVVYLFGSYGSAGLLSI